MRDRAMRAKRRAEALRLTLEGVSLVEIAERLGVSNFTAHRDIEIEIKAITGPLAQAAAEKREYERARSLARCEAMIRGAWEKAHGGDEKKAEIVHKFEVRRAKLLGLDAPTKVDTTVSVSELKNLSDEALAAIALGGAGAAAQETATPVDDDDADRDADDGGEP